MKTMKKTLCLLLTLALMFTLAISVLADDATGSLKVKGMTKGEVYELFKIFDLTYSGDNVSYTIASDWETFFSSTGDGAAYIVDNDTTPASLNSITVGGETKYINITEDNVEAFAQAALAYAVDLTPTKTYTAAAAGDYTFESLALGYYLMYPQGATEKTAGSICSLTSTLPDAEVSIKATYPTITKTVSDTDGVEIGQTITYTITGTIPDTTGYDNYLWAISDTMGTGLTFNGSPTVQVQGKSSTTSYATATAAPTSFSDFSTNAVLYLAGTNGFDMYFDMTKFQGTSGADVGKTVTITYTATVDDTAVAATGANSATLKYSNDPGDPFTKTKTSTTETKTVWTNAITVNKTDGSDSSALGGAEFVLYKKTGSGASEVKSYYKYTAATTGATPTPAKVEWTTTKTDATVMTTDATTGKATFAGIEDGTYYLEETKAPEGYNILEDDENNIEVTVAGSETAGDSESADVENFAGVELPSTGGMGTTIFYLAGAILALGSVVLFLTKKRVSIEG